MQNLIPPHCFNRIDSTQIYNDEFNIHIMMSLYRAVYYANCQ